MNEIMQNQGDPQSQAISGLGNGQYGDIPPTAFAQGPSPEPAPTPQETTISRMREVIESTNLAKKMDEDVLKELAGQVSDGFEADLTSRKEWENNIKSWTDLALQVREQKVWPWVGASNVKYPILSTASMQFNARSYPSLVPSTGNIVKCEVIGKDSTGQKLEKAKRLSTFLSYQVLNEMEGWEEGMDKLLMMLPIVGTIFKKTYYSSAIKKNCSEVVLPQNMVVNYWAKSLETAERVSEILYIPKRVLREKQLSGVFLDVELGDPVVTQEGKGVPLQDETTPYTIVEQHTYFDLDGDGYSEPYIVTFERESKTILRVTARFDDKTVFVSEDGKIQKIDAIQYYTKFSFIPNPDGGFYDIGFGLLLSPLNEAVNSLINQLIDAGTLNNLQGGFLGKGLKLKMGESRWNPGEWKTVTSTADDLRKQVIPLPTKEPSAVLFQLMGTLVTSSKELASVAEIFTGQMPGQNTPATTTMATIEQGMKVFTAVYKRVYRSLKSEFKKLFDLNGVYLDPQKYENIVDVPIGPNDFDNSDYDVCPGADPNTATQTEKLMKAQGLMELLPTGVLDPVKVVLRVLEAQEQPNIEQLLSQQVAQTGSLQPPPDPKLQEMQMKGQLEEQKAELKAQGDAHKSALQQRDMEFKQAMEATKVNQELQLKAAEAKVQSAIDIHKQRIFSATEQAKLNQSLVQKSQTHAQDMQHSKEKAALQNRQTRASGNGKKTK
jgi:chaperonin GroES